MGAVFGKAWRAAITALAFATALVASRIVLRFLGFQAPRLPSQAPESVAIYYLLVGSLLLSAAMVFLSTGISASRLTRWVVLAAFLIVGFALSTTVETSIFSSTEGTLLMIPVLIPPCLLIAGILGLLLNSPSPVLGVGARLASFFPARSWTEWTWRSIVAIAGFPIIYFTFGVLVSPIVAGYYATGTAGLALPRPGLIIRIEFLRGVLHFISIIPLLVLWGKSKRDLVLTLAVSFFAFVFTYDIILANQLPVVLTLVHGLEVLVSSFAYSLLLVLLLFPDRIPVQNMAA